ncbi:hypothetical protein ACHAXA_002305 [Cyclostephanos tholiformis]|uniref:Uncharacterized protein n=1 Tax=Cyclostephanos tholiformis TaxID=382380 RepID=A0ABD3RT56_9STRA
MQILFSECDAARERITDLMLGTEVCERDREFAARGLEAIETRLVEKAKELAEAKSRITSMATDGAVLVERACQSLLYASRVRIAAEARERDIARLEAERDDAISRSTSLEETVRKLRSRIESLNPPLNGATMDVRSSPHVEGGRNLRQPLGPETTDDEREGATSTTTSTITALTTTSPPRTTSASQRV